MKKSLTIRKKNWTKGKKHPKYNLNIKNKSQKKMEMLMNK